MVLAPKLCTLYEDWSARRRRLEYQTGGIAAYRAAEMQLLDFLLRQYRDSPEAARPAQFPLATATFCNHRAIVVHHHLGRGWLPAIANRQEAETHVRAMVDRIWSQSATSEITRSAEDTGSFATEPLIDPVEAVRTRLCDSDPAVRIHAALRLGEVGNLDDIGLLSDLLSLPTCPDEHPREREVILHAMQHLSGGTTESIDLSGLLSDLGLSVLPPDPELCDLPLDRKLPRSSATLRTGLDRLKETHASLRTQGDAARRGHRYRVSDFLFLILLILFVILLAVGGIVLIFGWMHG
jgi:hypothetical protein